MVEFLNIISLPAAFTEVIFLMVVSAVVGLVVYGIWKFIPDDETEQEAPWKPGPKPPLDATGWTLVVDGSNYAHRNFRNQLDVKLEHLEEVLSALERRFQNAKFIVFCDANLRYKVKKNEVERYDLYLSENIWAEYDFRETHGQAADGVMLKYACKNAPCIVVSNDKFENGEEVTLRQDVPLLKMRWRTTPVRAYPSVIVHGIMNSRTIPVGILIKDGKG